MIQKRLLYLVLFFYLFLSGALVYGMERFPPPDFVESDYQIPSTQDITEQQPDTNVSEFVDAGVLMVSLGLAVYLVFYKRSRKMIFWLLVFNLVYFGFVRRGCVCSIGAIQNVSLSLFDSGYFLPLTVTLFFVVPLVVTLFFGRVFCGAVCPLGAIQDLVLIKPLKVPVWLERVLRLFAYSYLAFAVLLAATSSAFIICRYDPFVAFFRLSGSLNMWVLSGAVLVIAMFVGRPYCRFLCPYGVILRNVSRLSRKRVTITPDECINCRLCENACPFGAITRPTLDWPEKGYKVRKAMLIAMLILFPVLTVLFGLAGERAGMLLSETNSQVRLARQIHLENSGQTNKMTDQSRAFRASGVKVETLHEHVNQIKKHFRIGGILAGLFIGFVAGWMLIDQSIQKKRTEYQADPASCLACGRCYAYCPKERLRLSILKETSAS